MTTKKMIQMSAMIVAFASASFAQNAMTATVTFPFAAQGVTLEPGTYQLSRISMQGGRKVFLLRNTAANRAILIPNFIVSTPKTVSPAIAKLVFQCVNASDCRLAEIHDESSQIATVPTPRKPKADQEERLLEVALIKPQPRGL